MLCKNPSCNKETKNPKYCCRSCSAKITNIGKIKSITKYCLYCNNKLMKNKKYCNHDCFFKHEQQININYWKSNESNIKNLPKFVRNYLFIKFNSKCCICEWSKINPKTNKIPLEVDHIDGNHENNLENNLRLLCPNCHSLTITYKSLNNGNGRYKRKQRYKEGKSY